MNKIVIDDVTKAKLGNLEQPAELCDESGRILAYVTPATSAYANLESPHSEEELGRREREQETYSTAEVLKRLEQL